MVVCIGSMGPDPEALVRYGARLAGRPRRAWYVLHVETSIGSDDRDREPAQARIERTFALAERLGGTPFRYRGDDVAGAILRFAREVDAGHVVVGRSARRPWWQRVLGRDDLMSRLLRDAAGLTVVVVDPRGNETLRRRARATAQDAGRSGRAGGGSDPSSLTAALAAGEVAIFDRPILRQQAVRRLIEGLGRRQPVLGTDALLFQFDAAQEEHLAPVGATDLHLVHLSARRLPRAAAALGVVRMAMDRDAPATTVIMILVTPEEQGMAGARLAERARFVLARREVIARLAGALDAAGVLAVVGDAEDRPGGGAGKAGQAGGGACKGGQEGRGR